MPFKELAQLKQNETSKAYMLEFQKLLVMVTDISMDHLVFLFTEGLVEPLKGYVKTHKIATLKDAMNLTRDMQNPLPKTKYPPKPTFPSKFKDDKKPWQKYLIGMDKKDGPSKEELKRKKTMFHMPSTMDTHA